MALGAERSSVQGLMTNCFHLSPHKDFLFLSKKSAIQCLFYCTSA